jgi:hypothetical protein
MEFIIDGFLAFAANQSELMVDIKMDQGKMHLLSFRTGYRALLEGRVYRDDDGSSLREKLREIDGSLERTHQR